MNQEWIVWDGGQSMGPKYATAGVLYDVKLRDGRDALAKSGEEVWRHRGDDGDIVAFKKLGYRTPEPKLLRPQAPPVRNPTPQAAKDNINQPSHYTAGKVECIDAIEAATTGLEGIEAVCTANVMKYIWRWKIKNGLEDLKKARWYLDRLISKIENNS